METFSTSVFKVLIWIFATTTKIRTRGCFSQTYVRAFVTTSIPSYSTEHNNYSVGLVSVTRFSAIHFQGYSIRQVSCYTLLSGFLLPWPPSCCPNEATPFMVSDERVFQHLNQTLGSSLIASSAYQKWPTRNFSLYTWIQLSKSKFRTHLKFENRLRTFRPQGL